MQKQYQPELPDQQPASLAEILAEKLALKRQKLADQRQQNGQKPRRIYSAKTKTKNKEMEQPIVLTIQQPYATLHAAGIKSNETRTSRPSEKHYKPGVLVLIHAAKNSTAEGRALAKDPVIATILKTLGYASFNDLPRGAIVGQVEYYAFRKAELLQPDKLEKQLGYYAFGNWVFLGHKHRLLKDPVPYLNGQGFYRRYAGNYNQLKFIPSRIKVNHG